MLLAGLLLSGCLGTQYLKKNEQLLFDQRIKGSKNVSTDALADQYQQTPNSKVPLIPFAPYVWFYQFGKKKYHPNKIEAKKDTLSARYDARIVAAGTNQKKAYRLRRKKNKKVAKLDRTIDEGNLLMRWGEPLAVFDSAKMVHSAQQMQKYLQAKGYFSATVNPTAKKLLGKRVRVEYNVQQGPPHVLDTLLYKTGDTAISNLINRNAKAALLAPGQVYDQDKLAAERDRIEALLKDNGYFDFSKLYIAMNVDTTWGNHQVAVQTEIKKPENRRYHKRYVIDSIIFTTDAQIKNVSSTRQHTDYSGITYTYYDRDYSEKVLRQRVLLFKNRLYSKTLTFETQKQLANLDIFKFININYDTIGGRFIANIFTSPLNKYQTTSEVGINVSQGLPGPFFNVSLKNRNAFKGLEIVEFNIGAGVEGVPPVTDNDDVFRSQEVSANLSLSFPHFVLVPERKTIFNKPTINPRTRLQLGYLFNLRPEYRRENFTASITYNWQNKKNTQYTFSLVEATLIDSDIRQEAFRTRLEFLDSLGNNLIQSFLPSFVSSTSFSVTFNPNNYGNSTNNKKGWYWRLFVESGGTSLNILGEDAFRADDFATYRFVRFNSDYRRLVPLTRLTTLAYRVNVGIAVPYGDNQTLPYEKFYFAGGSNSLRAWRPRRLGPGSYRPEAGPNHNVENDGLIDYSFEQPGELLLETSIELRRNLIGFIDGALFVDAGNIWTIQEDASRPNAEFSPSRFLSEIAVGTGLGFRFDFSFLVLRLDMGIKVYDPAREPGDRFVLGRFGFRRPFGPDKEPVIFNIGVGYPF